nr:hypothetical protein [uncultured Aquabacterium sp.]
MKKTDLVKNLGLKIKGQMQKSAIPGRFAEGSTAVPDRREQRKLDQAAGLVPFAVKLHAELVERLRQQALTDGVGINELTERLLRAALGEDAASSPAPAEAPAKKVAAKEVAAKKAPAKKTVAKKASTPS